VCQPFAFTPNPDGDASGFGSFTLTVWPAATVSLSQASGSPETEITLKLSGFSTYFSVDILSVLM
jgi:hypothetical protein